jgi:acyl-coenzyme A thioesterase PaaI-like protein
MENPVGLKLRFIRTAEGEVRAEYEPADHFQGYPGVLHGGIAAGMLDEASGRVHMGGDPPRFMFTAKLEVRYRKNIPMGQRLHVIGKAMGSRGRVAKSWAGIYDEKETLLAEAKAVLMDIPDEMFRESDLGELGWKVYPAE